jgi:hypothetical protein
MNSDILKVIGFVALVGGVIGGAAYYDSHRTKTADSTATPLPLVSSSPIPVIAATGSPALAAGSEATPTVVSDTDGIVAAGIAAVNPSGTNQYHFYQVIKIVGNFAKADAQASADPNDTRVPITPLYLVKSGDSWRVIAKGGNVTRQDLINLGVPASTADQLNR